MSSPCIACCKLDEQDICMGCYRSIDEIANWGKLDDEQQQQVKHNCLQREQQYAGVDYHSIEKFPITQQKVKAAKIS